jgi:hypothetical protein
MRTNRMNIKKAVELQDAIGAYTRFDKFLTSVPPASSSSLSSS